MRYLPLLLMLLMLPLLGPGDGLPLFADQAGDSKTLASSDVYNAVRLKCINPKAYAQFGHAVDLDGNYLVVGTCYDEEAAGEHGHVYVYRFQQGEWKPYAKLQPKSGSPETYFGWSVSISGKRILVGTRGGPAYLFVQSGDRWIEECRLIEKDLEPEDQFGWSVSLCGDLAVVGTWAEAVYVYRRSSAEWTREEILQVYSSDAFIGFGVSVAAERESILIGAPMDSVSGLWSGSAYLFTRNDGAWIKQTRLTPSVAVAGQGFGKKVDLSGDVAIVSAPDSQDHAGASYIFHRGMTGWREEARLDTGCTGPCDLFGGSVSVEGDLAAVGACGVSEADSWGAGTVYLFKRSLDQWRHISTLTAPQRQKECFFGYTIALDGTRILVGAHCQDCPKTGEDAGTAYVFDSRSY